MMRQLLLDIRPIAAPSLNNFVAGGNRDLLAHLRAMTGRLLTRHPSSLADCNRHNVL